MIALGEQYLGPERLDSAISNALLRAGNVIRRERPTDYRESKRPWVNAIFVVAGSLGEPEFQDVREVRFGKKENGLIVEIAIPGVVVDSGDFCEAIVRGLRGANAIAFYFFDEIGQDFQLREAEAIVTKVRDSLAN